MLMIHDISNRPGLGRKHPCIQRQTDILTLPERPDLDGHGRICRKLDKTAAEMP